MKEETWTVVRKNGEKIKVRDCVEVLTFEGKGEDGNPSACFLVLLYGDKKQGIGIMIGEMLHTIDQYAHNLAERYPKKDKGVSYIE
jgi:hypothetical protein